MCRICNIPAVIGALELVGRYCVIGGLAEINDRPFDALVAAMTDLAVQEPNSDEE